MKRGRERRRGGQLEEKLEERRGMERRGGEKREEKGGRRGDEEKGREKRQGGERRKGKERREGKRKREEEESAIVRWSPILNLNEIEAEGPKRRSGGEVCGWWWGEGGCRLLRGSLIPLVSSGGGRWG